MIKTLILTLIALTLTSCGCKDNSVGINGGTQLFPLRVGSYWKYKMQNIDSSGTISDTTTFIEAIISDTIVNSQTLYQYIPVGDFFSQDTKIYLANENDGVHEYSLSPITSYLLYKYPANINDQFVRPGDSIKVINLHQVIVTGAGAFDCIVYQQLYDMYVGPSGKLFYLNTYVAYGIGKVRYEEINYDQQMKPIFIGRLDLIEYKIPSLAG
jgi:hypothetical protein